MVPIGLGAHDVQPGGEPAEVDGRGVGHHQLAAGPDVLLEASHVLVRNQAAEDCRLAGVEGEGRRGLRAGEVIAAEIEHVGDVAFAGVDVLAIQVALAVGPVQLPGQLGVPLQLEVRHVAGNAGHGVHAPHGAVAPRRVEQSRRELALLIVVAAGEERLRLLVALGGEALGFRERSFHGAR